MHHSFLSCFHGIFQTAWKSPPLVARPSQYRQDFPFSTNRICLIQIRPHSSVEYGFPLKIMWRRKKCLMCVKFPPPFFVPPSLSQPPGSAAHTVQSRLVVSGVSAARLAQHNPPVKQESASLLACIPSPYEFIQTFHPGTPQCLPRLPGEVVFKVRFFITRTR